MIPTDVLVQGNGRIAPGATRLIVNPNSEELTLDFALLRCPPRRRARHHVQRRRRRFRELQRVRLRERRRSPAGRQTRSDRLHRDG
ncbi:MAG: hypothetical protein WKH64_08885 [Chloroflexia bacterium]